MHQALVLEVPSACLENDTLKKTDAFRSTFYILHWLKHIKTFVDVHIP